MGFNVIEEAVKLVKEKKKVDFFLNNYVIEQDPYTWGTAVYKSEPKLKLNMSITNDHISWKEQIDLDFVVFSKDLQDGSTVDKVIGGDLSSYPLAERQVMRLAFILYNGIKYGVDREVRKKDIEAGWHPRVVNVSMRYI